VFSGKVERSSVALLLSSRTLTTQVDVPNADLALRAGLYVSVTFKVPRTQAMAVIPAEAMVFNQRGTQVVIAGDDGQARWRTVHVQRDLGTTLEIDRGLEGGEQIVLSPPADLRDGQKIERQIPKSDGKPVTAAAR
jgi:multidrug efflux pump subunit AcrA (membrane-fusion protein)